MSNSSSENENKFSLEGIVIAVDIDGKCYFKPEGGNVASPTKTWKYDFWCKAFVLKTNKKFSNQKIIFPMVQWKRSKIFYKI